MCEKCAHPEIKHLTDENAVKPFQKKLNTVSLKGKSKKVKTN
jgi:hypothetical protein